jgi:predicted HicB family RNase H-like nuclease
MPMPKTSRKPTASQSAPTTRTKSIIVLVFPSEHQAIKDAAAQRGLSMNAYIRSLALRDAKRAA